MKIIGFRKYLNERSKSMILNSLPYKLYSRFVSKKKTIRFGVEVTTKCNLNCIMCTRAELVAKRELNVGEIEQKILKKVLDEMKKFVDDGYQVEFVPMGLGEPLLYKNLIDILTNVKKVSRKIRIVLVTNGVMLDKEKIKSLIDVGVDEISISLNTKNGEEYKKYLRADNYERVVKNILELLKYRNKKKGVTKIFVQYLNYENEKTERYDKEYKQWQKYMRNDDKCYLHPIVNQAGFYKKGSKIAKANYPCSMPGTRVSIKINGDMYPCDPCLYSGANKVTDLCLGNITEASVFDMFKDGTSKVHKILEDMKQGKYKNIPTCEKCTTYKINPNMYFRIPRIFKTKNIWW